MPIPHWVARANRYVTNPIMRTFAGQVRPLAVIEHVGRTSAKTYRTPVIAYPTPTGWVIPMTYGSGTDWEKNLEAAGGGTLVAGGERHPVTDPRVVTGEPPPEVPRPTAAILRLIGADEVLTLSTGETSPGPG